MKLNRYSLFAGLTLILVSGILKAITFPYSITPIIAVSLFSGLFFKNRQWSFTVPLLTMFFSDCLMEIFRDHQGFYGLGQLGNYFSLLAVTLLGQYINEKKLWQVLCGIPMASFLFFFLSNTNVYLFDTSGFYGPGFTGWIQCLIAGIPFLEKGMLTDLSFMTILLVAHHFISAMISRRKAIV